MPARDRNADGRPENARPRDGLGRPLPRGSQGVAPPATGVTSAEQALDVAQDLLDRELPFHAHEVLEEWWKQAPADERQLWQGLAQLAVGLTHQRRGNAAGAVSVSSRGAEALATFGTSAPYRVDVAGLRDWARRLAEDGAGTVPVPRLRR